MKRIFSCLMLAIFLFNIYPIPLAEAGIETPSYGFNLGKYEASTNLYHVGAGVAWWNGRKYWTDGPWSIYLGGHPSPQGSGTREGSVVAFSDVLMNTNNGYPLVGSDMWDQWITVFGGESGYVKGQLNSAYLGLSWDIKTPLYTKKFANLADIALLCGGQGGPFDTKKMYSTFYKSIGPTSSLTADKTAIRAGETVSFTIKGSTNTYYDQFMNVSFSGAGTTYFTDKRIDGKNITTTQPVTLGTPGTYTFSLLLKDSVMRSATAKTVIVSVSPVDQVPTPPVQPPDDTPPPPETPPEVNEPPYAKFDWPSSGYVGEAVDVDEYSVDYDGSIVDRDWDLSTTDAIKNLSQGGGTVNFNTPGNYDLTLTVQDNDGATDSVTHSIEVYKPIPTAIITTSGTLKENRKVVLSAASSKAPASWPIDHSKDEWVIEPLIGGTAADIKLGTRSGASQEILFKKTGTYRVKLRVTNAKGSSEWATNDILIVPDVPPIADFKLNANINYRNPSDANQAYLALTDTSMSSDGDTISQRTWAYKYDSDNDGDFSDETWSTISNTNNTTASIKVNKVGKYLFSLTAKESFGQETIPMFIFPADYRTGDTTTKANSEKIVEVKNTAPVTSFQAALKPMVDIVFSQGFLSAYSTRFPAMINNLETIVGNKLKSKFIDYAFYNINLYSPPQTNLVTIYKKSSGTTGIVYPPSRPSYVYNKERIYDLGSLIPVSSIIELKSSDDMYIYKYVSPDGINWYRITAFGGGSYNLNVPGNDIPSDVRYISFRADGGRFISWDHEMWLTYETPLPDYNLTRSSIYGGGNNIGPAGDNYSRTFDLGTLISRDEVTRYKVFSRGYQGTMYLKVSADNVNWYDVANWTPVYTKYHLWGTPDYYTTFIDKSTIPIQNFRYTKLVGTTVIDEYTQYISTAGGSPRATLADIKTQANLVTRPGAKKYVVSLAEEPYIDLSSANLDNTANALKNNNVYFTAFANPASIPTVQQLTSKLTEQKIITTATDLSAAMDQLADTIVASTVFSYSAGPFYLLLGQSMAYNPTYSDYESDPKVADNWTISHDPNYLDNNTGYSIYNNQTVSNPVSLLDKVGKYSITYKAQDDPTGILLFGNYKLWSNPAPTTIIVHRKPIANFTVTPGTINAIDSSYDPDFQYQRQDKGIIEWKWMWRKTSTATWTLGEPSGIPALGDYVIHLEVKDVYGAWSDPVEKTVTVTDLNKPPVANFSWTPTVIYEGDTVNLTNLSTDPDGDPLTYQWTTFDPNGVTKTYTTKNISLANVLPDTYWITLRVWDSHTATSVVTKSFSVGMLGITGHVEHTLQWNLNRIKYNQSRTGTDDDPRPYTMYFAGERFVLKADTTDTGASATKASSVSVDLWEKSVSDSLDGNAAKTFWQGEMWRENFQNISDGIYTFRFYVTYSNGVVKTDDVTIEIKDAWTEYMKLHRAH